MLMLRIIHIHNWLNYVQEHDFKLVCILCGIAVFQERMDTFVVGHLKLKIELLSGLKTTRSHLIRSCKLMQ